MAKDTLDSGSKPQEPDTPVASTAPEDPPSTPAAVVTSTDEHKSQKPKERAGTKRLSKERQKVINKRRRREIEVGEKELKRIKKKLMKAAKSTERKPERGVETWFRLASRNLYTRRKIVDSKASIMITINTLILSVVLGTVYEHLSDDPHLVYAVVPLVLANLISITFAILASKPRLRSGVFSEQDLLEHRVSLMTFDDFYAMSEEQYEEALDRVMQDGVLLYGTMKRDIYRLGVELSGRYVHIQRAYGVFLFGIVLATVMFGLCHALFG